MARKPKLEKLTVSLLKKNLTRQDVLRDVGVVSSHRVTAVNDEEDSLFVASTPPHPPGWKAYLSSHVADSLDGLVTASASAVLLLEVKDDCLRSRLVKVAICWTPKFLSLILGCESC